MGLSLNVVACGAVSSAVPECVLLFSGFFFAMQCVSATDDSLEQPWVATNEQRYSTSGNLTRSWNPVYRVTGGR